MGVPRDRHVLVVELEHDVGPVEARLDLLRLDAPDRDAGHAHVGLVGERRRLRELDVHAVRLRLERDGAAEGQPQEQEDPDA